MLIISPTHLEWVWLPTSSTSISTGLDGLAGGVIQSLTLEGCDSLILRPPRAMHNDRWFNVYSGEWHPILTGCYFQLHSRGYSSASSGWQLLDSVVCAGRDRSKDCGPLLYLFCHKVGPWSKELICRISCSLSPQLEVIPETLGARMENP